MKKQLLSLLLVIALSIPAFAEEEKIIDPSDLTRVYTQAAVFITSDADIRVSSMLTGAWSENTQFGGFVEAEFGDAESVPGKDSLGADYLGSRFQYYQVSGINNTLMPRVGFMLDVIHRNNEHLSVAIDQDLDNTLLASGGVIGIINPEYTGGAMIFPNANYTMGELFGESAQGYLLNLFVTFPVGDAGAFIQAWPEYLNVSGDTVEMESIAFNVMFNAPIRSDRMQWLMTKLQYASADVTTPTGTTIEGDYQLKAEIGVKWFF